MKILNGTTKKEIIILPREAQKKEKQKFPKRTIDKLPTTFSYVFSHFLNAKNRLMGLHGTKI